MIINKQNLISIDRLSFELFEGESEAMHPRGATSKTCQDALHSK